MDKKLNNLLSFKEFELKTKPENKPGKTFENFKSFDDFNVDENIFSGIKKFVTNTTEKDLAEAEKSIMANPTKKNLFLKLKTQNPEAAQKYIEFFAKYPNETPQWDSVNKKWVSRSVLSYQNAAPMAYASA